MALLIKCLSLRGVVDLTDIYSGFDDSTLEFLASKKSKQSLVAFSSWSAEANGLGETFRYVSKLPNGFPLVFFSDHGVGSHVVLAEYEYDNLYRTFVTWNPIKRYFNRSMGQRCANIVQMPHPFPIYWRMKGKVRSPCPRGTVVFLNHSTPEYIISEFFSRSYLADLLSLPEECHPIVLCLHSNDVLNGEHIRIREICDLPMITMGFPGDPGFCDRFYDTVSNFRYASSPIEMSTLFYCVDFGIPYFICGSHEVHTDANTIDRCTKNLVTELFSEIHSGVTESQRDFVDMMLGKRNRCDRWRLLLFVWTRLFSLSFFRLVCRDLYLKVARR
jgi:hypothetical protein